MNTRREFRSAVGKVVGTVTVPQTVVLVDDEDIHSQNLKPLASYNWINDPNPTIMVPGTRRILALQRITFSCGHSTQS